MGEVKCSSHIALVTPIEKYLYLIAQVLFCDMGEKVSIFSEVSFGYINKLFSRLLRRLFFEIRIKTSSYIIVSPSLLSLLPFFILRSPSRSFLWSLFVSSLPSSRFPPPFIHTCGVIYTVWEVSFRIVGKKLTWMANLALQV